MSFGFNAICKIIVETSSGIEKRGTGFFISKTQILTCNHVVEDEFIIIKIINYDNLKNGNSYTAKIIHQCSLCDFALLEINEDYQSDKILELCESDIVEDESFGVFGFPDTPEGQLIGKKLIGKISRIVEDSSVSIHDIILNISDYSQSENYAAFSGSPLVNDYGHVIAILKYRDDQHLAAVSIKKAASFLKENNIKLKPDQLNSFEHYSKNVFELYPEDRKTDCETYSENALNAKNPTEIVKCIGGDLFYPKQNLSVQEIIAGLRKDKDLNNSLWKGWIKLLTYIEIIKGNSSDINMIQFNLNEIDLKILYGEHIISDKKISIPLQLSFYFTKEKSYFQIARSFLPIKNNQKNNTCSIFNSSHEHFNTQKFTNSNKKKIILDISGLNNSNFKIEEKINFGVLSLEELSTEIVNSESLIEASQNIEKLFIDAIK